MGYQINKGVGAPLDFFGLKSQYIVYFMIGMVLAFILFFVFQLESKLLGFIIGGVVGLVSYFGCHWANRKFGRIGAGLAMSKTLLPNRIPAKRARDVVRFTKR